MKSFKELLAEGNTTLTKEEQESRKIFRIMMKNFKLGAKTRKFVVKSKPHSSNMIIESNAKWKNAKGENFLSVVWSAFQRKIEVNGRLNNEMVFKKSFSIFQLNEFKDYLTSNVKTSYKINLTI